MVMRIIVMAMDQENDQSQEMMNQEMILVRQARPRRTMIIFNLNQEKNPSPVIPRPSEKNSLDQ